MSVGNDQKLNNRIKELNNIMCMFCQRSDYIYIEHRKLQVRDDWYEDSVHINSNAGVRSFVRDIHNAFTTTRRMNSYRDTITARYSSRWNGYSNQSNQPEHSRPRQMKPTMQPSPNAWSRGPPNIHVHPLGASPPYRHITPSVLQVHNDIPLVNHNIPVPTAPQPTTQPLATVSDSPMYTTTNQPKQGVQLDELFKTMMLNFLNTNRSSIL